MGRLQLGPGTRLLLDEHLYIVRDLLVNGRYQLENL